jgi:hypothetical protein
LTHKYQICTIDNFFQITDKGQHIPQGKFLILRHDIDTDPATARAMWEIERPLGIAGSYYFRLGTFDLTLVKDIEEGGGEVGYHYEELATFAKRYRLKTKEEIHKEMPAIRDEFARNLIGLRRLCGLSIRTVASHGDFANRRLNITNCEILADQKLRHRLGIEVEAYDNNIMRFVKSRHSDAPYPRFWNPSSPVLPIISGVDVIHILVHPRQWKSNIRISVIEDSKRFFEGLRYL